MDVEVIHLNGSVELSCVVDMVDAIVDIVQTGSTLTANGLVEKKHISEINAKLITNKESYFKQSSEIERLIKQLECLLTMLSAQQFLKEFNNVESLDESLYEIVSQICEEVKLQGDKALKIIIYNLIKWKLRSLN